VNGNSGNRCVAIWIDRRQAVIAIFVGTFPDNWIEVYGRGPHPNRYGGWLEYQVEARPHEMLKSFHDEVVARLTSADAILLLGPGQPKHKLARYIAEHGGHLGQVVHMDTAPRLTEAELIAHATAFFRPDKS
jgi:stalled ribosome rescue protein Dom34